MRIKFTLFADDVSIISISYQYQSTYQSVVLIIYFRRRTNNYIKREIDGAGSLIGKATASQDK